MTSHWNKREGFTLVELLVVITIIGLLAGMLIPAVNYAREAARRTQCINHQRNLTTAMSNYDLENGALPGHLNQLGRFKAAWTDPHNPSSTIAAQSPRYLSWVVALFPFIEENQRYNYLTKDTPDPDEVRQAISYANSQPNGRVPVLFCPSARLDSHTSDGYPRLSYVVNCGPEAGSGSSITGKEAIPQTIFRDRRNITSGTAPNTITLSAVNKKVKTEDIVDGRSNTVIISENIQTWTWYGIQWSSISDSVGELIYPDTSTTPRINTRNIISVASMGFVWSDQAVSSSFDSRITGYAVAESPLMQAPSGTSAGAQARPSSAHPGIVIMGYADGTARAVNDDIGRGPYLSAVCPNDALAKKPTADGGLDYGMPVFQQNNW